MDSFPATMPPSSRRNTTQYNPNEIDMDNISDRFSFLNSSFSGELSPNRHLDFEETDQLSPPSSPFHDLRSTGIPYYNLLSPPFPPPRHGFTGMPQSQSPNHRQLCAPGLYSSPAAAAAGPSNQSHPHPPPPIPSRVVPFSLAHHCYPFPGTSQTIWGDPAVIAPSETVMAEEDDGRCMEGHTQRYTKQDLYDMMVHRSSKEEICSLFQRNNKDELDRIIYILTNDTNMFSDICTHANGSRSMIALLNHLGYGNQIFLILSALAERANSLAMDAHGWRIIKECVKLFNFYENRELLKNIAERCLQLATDQFGASVLPSCLIAAKQEVKERMVQLLVANTVALAEDPYGNFVVQYLLQQEKTPRLIELVLSQLWGNFASLSMNKYGSHVVEKSLKHSSKRNVERIIDEIMRSPEFIEVLEDPYGNFVAQTAVKESTGKVQADLLYRIRKNEKSLDTRFGKMVLKCSKSRKNGQ